ncbi:MAG: Maff2 family protein [Angelakisella sp.]
MAIFTAAIDLLRGIVTVIGGGMAILGLIQFFSGQSDNNAASKQSGVTLLIAGAGIIMVGQILVPMLAVIP